MKKRMLLLVGLCGLTCTVTSARGFLGFMCRALGLYTAYKFVDGVSDSSISQFVNRNADAPIDAVCSFGKGVKTFGFGIRNVAVTFANEKSDHAFSKAWEALKQECSNSVNATKQEWKERREAALAKKEAEKRYGKTNQQVSQATPKVDPAMPLAVKQETSTVATQGQQKESHAIG